MRLGGGDDSAAGGGDEGGEFVDVTDGEALYEVLAAALKQASDAQQLRIVMAFQNGTPWASLDGPTRDLFELAGEALFEEDDDEDDEEGE